jgi:hypothetical protein
MRFASRPWITGMTVLMSMSELNCLTRKRFVTADEELVMGGSVQKLVCTYVSIYGRGRASMFWEEKGGTVRRQSNIHFAEKQ